MVLVTPVFHKQFHITDWLGHLHRGGWDVGRQCGPHGVPLPAGENKQPVTTLVLEGCKDVHLHPPQDKRRSQQNAHQIFQCRENWPFQIRRNMRKNTPKRSILSRQIGRTFSTSTSSDMPLLDLIITVGLYLLQARCGSLAIKENKSRRIHLVLIVSATFLTSEEGNSE